MEEVKPTIIITSPKKNQKPKRMFVQIAEIKIKSNINKILTELINAMKLICLGVFLISFVIFLGEMTNPPITILKE
jgi:hypothetical protein